jgi:hypothetical protein
MGAPRSKYVAGATGDVLVLYDEASEASWIDAIGRDVRKWELRHGCDYTTAKEFTVTAVNASTVAHGVPAGIKALITSAGAENDGINMQLIGTPFQLAANKPLYFGCKVTLSHATRPDFFVGLASTDTALIAAHAIDVAASAVGWYNLSTGAGALTCYNEIHANSVITASGDTLDTSAHVYEFMYDGAGNLDFYFDRVYKARHSTYVPTVVLTPSIVLQNGTANALTAAVEWMRCIQVA